MQGRILRPRSGVSRYMTGRDGFPMAHAERRGKLNQEFSKKLDKPLGGILCIATVQITPVLKIMATLPFTAKSGRPSKIYNYLVVLI